MKCTITPAAKSLTLHLSFYRDELIYDIKNLAYIESHAMPDEQLHARHQVADIDESGNSDRLNRVLNLKYRQCVELLHRWTRRSLREGETMDNRPDDSFDYTMQLQVPVTFSRTSADYLLDLIHEYLVCSTIADWLGILYPTKYPIWQQRAADAISEMTKLLGHRTRRVRLTPHWLS